MGQAAFWKDTGERAIRTTAQIMVTMIIAAGTGLLDTDWLACLSAAGMAGVLSVLTSLGSEMKSPDGTASLVSTPPPTDGQRAEETRDAPEERAAL